MHILLYDPTIIFLDMYSSKIYANVHQEKCIKKFFQNDPPQKKHTIQKQHKSLSTLERINNM